MWVRREFEANFEMDGLMCLKAKDGSLVIKKRKFYNWVALLVILFIGGPLFVLLVWGFIQEFSSGKATFWGILQWILYLGFIIAILIPAIRIILNTLRRPDISFSAASKQMEFTQGSIMRQIPFSAISKLVIDYRGGSGQHIREIKLMFGFVLFLADGNKFDIGTVSGGLRATEDKAEAFSRWFVALTGTGLDRAGLDTHPYTQFRSR